MCRIAIWSTAFIEVFNEKLENIYKAKSLFHTYTNFSQVRYSRDKSWKSR